MTSIPITRIGLHRGPLFRPESAENPNQKSLVSIIESTSGIHSLLVLPAGMRDDAEFLCASVLPDIERNLGDDKRRKMLRGVGLYLNNALAHNTKRSEQEIARTKATTVGHPTSSPDAVPSDFFLLDYLKGEMANFTMNSPSDILSEIRRTFQEISTETLVGGHAEWITRLEWITEHKGESYHTKEKNPVNFEIRE